jgi:hypothetical protein
MKSSLKSVSLVLAVHLFATTAAMAAPIVEQITFKTKPRVTRVALVAALRATDAELKREPGFVSRQLLVDEKGVYRLIITWQSLADARRAEESETQTPESSAVEAMIDEKSVTFHRAEVLLPAP